MKYAGLVVIVVAIALVSTAMIYAHTVFYDNNRSPIRGRDTGPIESQDLIVSNIDTTGNLSGIENYPPLVSTYPSSAFRLYSGPLGSLEDYSPIVATFPYSVFRIVGSEYFMEMSLAVEPADLVEGNAIGAGRWYAFEIKVFYLLGLSSTRAINISFTAPSLDLIIHYNGSTWTTINKPPYINVTIISRSTSEVLVIANSTFPWSLSGDLNITGVIVDQFGVSTTYSWSYTIVNITDLKLFSTPKQSYGMMEYIALNGSVTYAGTSIPVTSENINVSIIRGGSIVATVDTTTDSNGFFTVALKAPSVPGVYNLTIDPEHGEPVTYTIEVVKELGGEAIPLYENIVIIVLLLLAVVLSASLILYRKNIK